ncbi:MAG TPA: signal peptidase I [Gaiellales bacterium]|nr:signal peptidase I [Gaiellales bacterium]
MSGADPGPPQDAAAPVESHQPDTAAEIPEAATAPAPPPRRRRRFNPFVELIVILAIAFALAYVIQAYVVRPYKIPSASMEPTLEVGDMVLVNRFIYRFESPQRGDIIVFHPPGMGQQAERGATTQASVNFIKRVIGLPGETVQIVHGTVLICKHPHVGCAALHESYLDKPPDRGSFGPYVVPQGDYFVMGDNRIDSLDSRFWGPVPRRNIIGEAFMIYWPLTRLGFL